MLKSNAALNKLVLEINFILFEFSGDFGNIKTRMTSFEECWVCLSCEEDVGLL